MLLQDLIPGGEMRILIVDDEEELCEALKDFFEYKGYEVYTSDTGEKALEVVNTQSPNWVLLDIKLPDISGLDVLKEIKRRTTNTNVVMITGGLDDGENLEKSLRLGAFEYITKPFTLDYLENVLLPKIKNL